jgi:hypothetical protein
MRRLLVLCVVSATVPAGLASAQARESRVSWADPAHQYGWTDATSGGPIVLDAAPDVPCRGANRGSGSTYICSTENGGRTWRRVFQGGWPDYFSAYVRTSRVAGLVALSREDSLPKTLRNNIFWTRDNGKHWYETTRIGLYSEGRGRSLYWLPRHGRVLYKVDGWPPRRPVRCPGFWVRHPRDQHPRRDGNICVGGPVNAEMRARPVARIGDEPTWVHFSFLAVIPDGVIALVSGAQPFRVLIRRDGVNRLVALPEPDAPGAIVADRFEVRWPSLLATGRVIDNRGVSRTFDWRSTDGGDTWTVTPRG